MQTEEWKSLYYLNGIETVGGAEIVVMDDLRTLYPERFNEGGGMDWEWFEKDIRPNKFVYLRKDKNSISFTLQNGPVKENGVNGCQVDAIIETAKILLEGFNKAVASRETSIAITKLDEALMWLEKRTKDRVKRKVEGTNAQ